MKDITVVVKFDWDDNGVIRKCTLKDHGSCQSELEAVKGFIDWLSEDDPEWQLKCQAKNGMNFSIETFVSDKDNIDDV